jgi:uracil-DNA glycosylase
MLELDESWKEVLGSEFQKPYMLKLKSFLTDELNKKKIIYPHGKDIFAALNYTPFHQVKVVIIGQDPYHGPHQAHGLCFSVKENIPCPPSLKNIFKELENDLKIPCPKNGTLTSWAKEGVLLLNTILTVEKGRPLSHMNKGWEEFTDVIVDSLNKNKSHLVFLLWGSSAHSKGKNIDTTKHLVLKSVHPSPLSAHRGFFGQKYFSKANDYLKKYHGQGINWTLH